MPATVTLDQKLRETAVMPLPPIDPRLRVLLIAVRHALLILADAIGDYCQVRK